MSKFGQGTPAGRISICAQCKNKSEVKVYPNDNPDPICEDCYKENLRLETQIEERHKMGVSEGGPIGKTVRVINSSSSFAIFETPSSERQRYIDVIVGGANSKWLDSFIQEVIVKRVLQYDWKTIIQNERWFSILDLRRLALEVDPGFENAKPVEDIKSKYSHSRKRNKGASHAATTEHLT